MVTFKKAKTEDAGKLTEVQIRTFDDDSRKFAKKNKGGPPGYDSVKWQIETMRKALYYKISDDDKIIGGIIIFEFKNGHYHLGRIYIDPGFQNQGIGSLAMKFIDSTFTSAKKWTLGTPDYAVRNHHFYEKAGFIKIGEDGPVPEGFMEILYEKIVNM